jgi:hypothetical protein
MINNKIKNGLKTSALLAVLITGVATLGVGCACHRPPPDGHAGAMMGGPEMKRHHPMPMPWPLMSALDTNRDGIIDANEIANASTSLKMLDKNGDGRLTPDELRPMRMARHNN